MWIDSHCHVDALPVEWRPNVAFAGLAVGVDVDDWSITQARLANWSGEWRQAIGFHPWRACQPLDWLSFERWLSDDGQLAVGEIGLDGSVHHREHWQSQLAVFERQLAMVQAGNRVVSLHAVQDQELVFQMVKRLRLSRVIVHGFQGSLVQALRWQELGCYIGIGPRLLFHLTDKRRDMLQGLALSHLLLETDAPYGYRDALTATPDDVVRVGGVLSSVLSLEQTVLMRQLEQNWQTLWA